MSLKYSYSDESFCFISRPDNSSLLDTKLQSIWKNKMIEGCFRYELGDLRSTCLPGKYNFIIQLNIKRAIERRKPQLVSDINMQFDPENFHFGKVPEKEVIFMIEPQHWQELILNFDGLRIAVEVMLASFDRYFRVGFNSLGGYASVNHLHLHSYYLRHKLFLEHAPANHLKGPCYELTCFPSEGFVFEVLKKEDIMEAVGSVIILINFLIEKKIAHNVFLTRGMGFSEMNPYTDELHSLRIYVWAREACYGVKDELSFNIAVCELAGHIPMKDLKSFESITENEIAVHLHKVCHDTFISIRDQVKKLYEGI